MNWNKLHSSMCFHEFAISIILEIKMKKFQTWSMKIFDSEWLCELRGNPDRQPSNLLNDTLSQTPYIIMSTLSQSDTYFHWKPYKVQSCRCATTLREEDNIKCFDSRCSSSQHRTPLPVTAGPRLISHALRPDRRNMSDMQVVSWKHDGTPCLTKSSGAAEDDISAFFLREKQWSEQEVYREDEDTRLHPSVWNQFCFSCNPRQRLAKSHEDSAQTLTLEKVCAAWTLWNPPPTPPHRMSWRTKSRFLTTSNFSSHHDENTLSVLLRFRRVLLEAVIFSAGSEKYEI